jgi:hypothetical protein
MLPCLQAGKGFGVWSGFQRIIVGMLPSGIATDEVSETEPVQVGEIALPDTQMA